MIIFDVYGGKSQYFSPEEKIKNLKSDFLDSVVFVSEGCSYSLVDSLAVFLKIIPSFVVTSFSKCLLFFCGVIVK